MARRQRQSVQLAAGLRCDALSGPEAESRVVDTVLNAIRDLHVRPGARLVERELALTSGASRSAVRNGLLRLAQSGLVELRANRGATIATSSPEEARQVFEARHVIENSLIRQLAGTATPASVAPLRSLVEDERQAYAANRFADARHLSRGFHLLLAELAGNRLLLGYLRDLIDKQPLLSWSSDRRAACFCGNAAHAKIAAAVERGDADAAVELNAEHLRELERMLSADRNGPPVDEARGDEPESPPPIKALSRRKPTSPRGFPA